MAKTKQMVAAHAEFYKKQHQLAQEAMYADNKRFAEERRIEEIAQDKRDEKESRKILGLKKMKSERCASTTLKGVRCKNKVSRDHTCGIHLRKSTEAPQPLPKSGLQINSLGDKEWCSMANVIVPEAFQLLKGQTETRSGGLMASFIVRADFLLSRGQMATRSGGLMVSFIERADFLR
jgi:hypothetical protein